MSMLPVIADGVERVACHLPRQWLYLLGDEGGVLYSEARGRFAGLDAAGVAAFLEYDSDWVRGRRPERGMEAIFDLSRGVFPDAEPEEPGAEPEIFSIDQAPASIRARSASESGAGVEAELEIGGIPVLVQYPGGELEDLCRDYLRRLKPASSPPRCRLSVEERERGWAILVNGRTFLELGRSQQLGLGLMHAARTLLYELGSYDVALHAAMVAGRDLGLLLCAPRESGKSTLAAYLVAHGFELLADEPALLDLDARSVQSLPLPISLKRGSWTCLEREWPGLGGGPAHLRSDGMPIRLLHPPEERVSDRPRRLTHLVFPSYSRSSPAPVERLSPLRALCLLNSAGILLRSGGTRESFESLLALLLEIPAFTLPFSTPAGAARVIVELFPGD